MRASLKAALKAKSVAALLSQTKTPIANSYQQSLIRFWSPHGPEIIVPDKPGRLGFFKPAALVKLKNGFVVPKELLVKTAASLRQLLENDYALYDFLRLCNHPEHEPFSLNIRTLLGLGLIKEESGVIEVEPKCSISHKALST